MTPDTIRILTNLREQFYTQFAAAMDSTVSITHGNASTSSPAMAFWVDDRQRLNYLRIYAHTAPDALVPERPFVLRVSINKGIGTPIQAKRPKTHQGQNQGWHFELTVLPEEILDFVPWIVSVVSAQEKYSLAAAQTPPYPLSSSRADNEPFLNDAWTNNAWQRQLAASSALSMV
jgi:hypothetical protein